MRVVPLAARHKLPTGIAAKIARLKGQKRRAAGRALRQFYARNTPDDAPELAHFLSVAPGPWTGAESDSDDNVGEWVHQMAARPRVLRALAQMVGEEEDLGPIGQHLARGRAADAIGGRSPFGATDGENLYYLFTSTALGGTGAAEVTAENTGQLPAFKNARLYFLNQESGLGLGRITSIQTGNFKAPKFLGPNGIASDPGDGDALFAGNGATPETFPGIWVGDFDQNLILKAMVADQTKKFDVYVFGEIVNRPTE